jgi:hypothetical protein
MAEHMFPLMDFNKYLWKQDPEDSLRYMRHSCGGEYLQDILNRFTNGEGNLFLNVELELESSVPTEEFFHNVQAAWIALRRDVPTIASHIEYAPSGTPLLTYRIPKDETEVQLWADRTVVLSKSAALDDLRFEIGQRPLPNEDRDQTFLYVVPFSEVKYGLILYTHHLPFDGHATKDLMTTLLKTVSRSLSKPSHAEFQLNTWGNEAQKLLPPITDVLGCSEEREGPLYTQTLGSILKELENCASVSAFFV